MRHAVSQTVFRTRRIRRRDVSGAARETPRAPHRTLNLAPYLALKFALTRAPGLKTISAERRAPSAERLLIILPVIILPVIILPV